jgi:hypothetical protein
VETLGLPGPLFTTDRVGPGPASHTILWWLPKSEALALPLKVESNRGQRVDRIPSSERDFFKVSFVVTALDKHEARKKAREVLATGVKELGTGDVFLNSVGDPEWVGRGETYGPETG